ncbi:hypothetical protein IV203_007703 [Nitzschia inconspicua]|uniref:Uncharacterized protein n=1 Tax=Nitzschia inconspicua TaxID=303405 RepID=A0A9K3PL99_9STRA|nr:hypothetical protein IV203_007703 [Nitzschia inconspicua]
MDPCRSKHGWCLVVVLFSLARTLAFHPFLQQRRNFGSQSCHHCKRRPGERTIVGSSRLCVNANSSEYEPSHPKGFLGRRETLLTSLATASTALPSLFTGLLTSPPAAVADESDSSGSPSSAADVLKSLGTIPTFVLVQGDTGVPFMIFNGENGATGYFFLSYNIAEQALRDAREKDKQNGAANIWNAAQIRVVPLSIAMQLALSTKQRTAVNEEKGKRYQAQHVWRHCGLGRGKHRCEATRHGTKQQPLQVEQHQRQSPSAEYKKQALLETGVENAALSNDKIKVVEMMNLFRSASRKNDWTTLQNVTIMPVKESNQVAVKIIKEMTPGSSPYNFDKVFLVSSSK